MKKVFVAIALVSASFASLAVSSSSPISDLYNTGTGLTKGTPDQNYTVINPDFSSNFGYATDMTSGYPIGDWIPNTTTSAWDSPAKDPSASLPAGKYLWTTTFDLTGFDVSSASFVGRFAADNYALAYLNGNQMGTSNGFSNWSNFSSVSNFFVQGMNTIDFLVYNEDGPTGLRVEYTDSYASPTMAAVPEPETYALLLAGLGVLGFVARRRRAR